MRSPLQQPLRFRPHFRPMPWGGRALGRFLGKNLPPDEPIGESWEVSDHAAHASVLTTGSWYGQTLRQLMERHAEALVGSGGPKVFPWLVKLLDARDTLSVQVHPDAEKVQTLWPGEGSKSECWLVLDAQPDSVIYAGLKPGVDRTRFERALREGSSVVECLHRFTPQVGDFISLPAGTIHALGGGLLVAEIQETSDATFRLYDWERRDAKGQPREMHHDAGLASLHWPQPPVEPTATRALGLGRHALLRSTPFDIDLIHADDPFTLGGDGRLHLLFLTEGQGRLASGEFLCAGDVWILPAIMPEVTFQPEGRLRALVCSLP